MNVNNMKQIITPFNILLVLFIIFIILIILLFNTCNKDNSCKPRSPVEEYRIEQTSKANAELIKEIKELDSIKHEKINEVKSLDNDSTLSLFYKLIRK